MSGLRVAEIMDTIGLGVDLLATSGLGHLLDGPSALAEPFTQPESMEQRTFRL